MAVQRENAFSFQNTMITKQNAVSVGYTLLSVQYLRPQTFC